jgi:spore maturation protein CgeB
MKLVVFGLTYSSSWGNGHATLWRALARGLSELGHRLVFFERDVPWYAPHRDCVDIPGGALVLHRDFAEARARAREELRDADAALVTSYCADGAEACELVLASDVPVRAFYDMDTPVTLARLGAGDRVSYLPRDGLTRFDVALSFTGGRALDALRTDLGARAVAPLYGSVDPTVHAPVPPSADYASDCTYLGTYSEDRQSALSALFLEPADRLPERRFLLGGSQYPESFPWRPNVHYVHHVAPPEHAAFYCSSPVTVNVTRRPMAAMGHCPSGRLFEAAACGTAVLSDAWEGLESFFEPGREILVARTADEAVAVLGMGRAALAEVGRAARARALAEHSGLARARELVALLEGTRRIASARTASGGRR